VLTPPRRTALEGLVAEVAADPGTWTTTLGGIARHARGPGLAPQRPAAGAGRDCGMTDP